MVGNDNAESRLLKYQRHIPITSIFSLSSTAQKAKRENKRIKTQILHQKNSISHTKNRIGIITKRWLAQTQLCSFTINSPNLVNRYDVKVSHLWRARSLSSLLTRITSLFELHIFHTQLKSYLVRCVFSCNCWLPYTESGGFFKLAILLLWLLPKVFAVNASFIFIFFLLLATSHHPTDGQKLCPG